MVRHDRDVAVIVKMKFARWGSRCGTIAMALKSCAKGKIDPRPLISRTFPLRCSEGCNEVRANVRRHESPAEALGPRTKWRCCVPAAGRIMGQGVGSRDHASTQAFSTQLGRAEFDIFAAMIASTRFHRSLTRRWKAKPPGKARTIAAIFTHMHNVAPSLDQAYSSAPEGSATTDRAHCTPRQAVRDWPRAPLAARRCSKSARRWWGPRREVSQRRWGQPWPVGPETLCYMVSDEADHRGQVCTLAISSDSRCRTS